MNFTFWSGSKAKDVKVEEVIDYNGQYLSPEPKADMRKGADTVR